MACSAQYTSRENTYDEAQCGAYGDALNRAQNKVRWLAMVDVDEFLVPVTDDDLTAVLASFESDPVIGVVCAAWVCYGTSHVPKIPQDRLMIETLILSEPSPSIQGAFPWDQGTFKSIVRADRAKSFENPHMAVYNPGRSPVPLDGHLMQINHYWTRDEAFFNTVKLSRNARRGVPVETSISWAAAMNKERPQNAAILRFVPSLRKRMSLIA